MSYLVNADLSLALVALQLFALLIVIVALSTQQSNKAHPENRCMPVSVIAPVFNEACTVVPCIKAILAQDYEKLELIVINDGSTDGTLQSIIDEFECQLANQQGSEALYTSRLEDRLTVISKTNEGKAKSLNIGIEIAQHDLICTVDGDTILEPQSLRNLAAPIIRQYGDQEVVASTGNQCLLNGQLPAEAVSSHGKLVVAAQHIEYLRTFGLERQFWSLLNASIIVPGAFTLYRRDVIEAVGGFRSVVGEDLDLVVRIYRSLWNENLRIVLVPSAVCWTLVPDSFADYVAQRIRWHQGLLAQGKAILWLALQSSTPSYLRLVAAYFMIVRVTLPLAALGLVVSALIGAADLILPAIVAASGAVLINLVAVFYALRQHDRIRCSGLSSRLRLALMLAFEPLLSGTLIFYQVSSIYNLVTDRNSYTCWDSKRLRESR